MADQKKNEDELQDVQQLLNNLTNQLNIPGFDVNEVLQRVGKDGDASMEEMMESLMGLFGEKGADLSDFAANEEGDLDSKGQSASAAAARYLAQGEHDLAQKAILRALTLDPLNTEARLMALPFVVEDDSEYEQILDLIILEEERWVDIDELRTMDGKAWENEDARGYLMARSRRVLVKWLDDKREEAVNEALDLLQLDEEDHTHIRAALVPYLLEMGQVEKAWEILDKYEDDPLPHTLWCRVLERHLAGNQSERDAALEEAREEMEGVEAYLTGAASLEEEDAEDEDALIASTIYSAWQKHPEAITWLKSVSRRQGRHRTDKKKR